MNNNTNNENTTILTRANKCTVRPDTAKGYRADFFRTHKPIATVYSADTDFTPDTNSTKSAQREDFRRYITANAADHGILWQPEDMRTPANTRVQSYFNDEILKLDVSSLLQHDIPAFIEKMPNSALIAGYEVTVDSITPKTKTSKGSDLSTMGVTDGKYNKSGAWAWADIEVTITMTIGEGDTAQQIYQTMGVELVSGQLKKPHMTQTAWNESTKASLLEIGAIKADEPKADATKMEKSTKEDKPKAEKSKTEKPKTDKKKSTKNKQSVQKTVDKIEEENAKVGNI